MINHIEPEPAQSVQNAEEEEAMLRVEDLVDLEFAINDVLPPVTVAYIVRHSFPGGILTYTLQLDQDASDDDDDDRVRNLDTHDTGTPEEPELVYSNLETAIRDYWSGRRPKIRNRDLLVNHLIRDGLGRKYNRFLWQTRSIRTPASSSFLGLVYLRLHAENSCRKRAETRRIRRISCTRHFFGVYRGVQKVGNGTISRDFLQAFPATQGLQKMAAEANSLSLSSLVCITNHPDPTSRASRLLPSAIY
jgi:hypothetical protein